MLQEKYKRHWKIYNTIIIAVVILTSFPRVFQAITAGLDSSWMYALNKFFAEGYVYGNDIVFTYGPLGWLFSISNIGNNMLLGMCFWSIILGMHGLLLYQYLFIIKKDNYIIFTVVSLLLFAISDNQLPEYYICYLAILALCITISGIKQDIYIFCALFMLSLYLKFSLFMMIGIALVIYVLLGYFYDKNLYAYCRKRIFGAVVLLPFIYFVLEKGTIRDFVSYIKGMLELAGGYSVAMSMGENDSYIIWIIIAAVAWFICVVLSYKKNFYNTVILSVTSGCLFMCYKHGFVRDDHYIFGMNAMLLFLSISVMFLDWNAIRDLMEERKKSIFYALYCGVIGVAIVQNGFSAINIVGTIRNRVFELPMELANTYKQEQGNINKLPDTFLNRIGDSTVSIYPWEISYCASNDLNYIPLAAVQAYSIYTNYLDEISAKKLMGDGAPSYIIFSLDTIDNRYPLIECPQTWETIKNNYYIDAIDGSLYLLKHREQTVEADYESIGECSVGKESRVQVNEADYVKIDTDLNIKGKLAKMFWKIPEVYMHVHYENGQELTKRVLLDMFAGGVDLSTIVCDNNTFIDTINGEKKIAKVSYVEFEGAGLKYYKNDMMVEYFNDLSTKDKVNNYEIGVGYAEETSSNKFSEFSIIEGAVNSNIDSNCGNAEYSELKGWAYVDGVPNQAEHIEVYIEEDGVYYKCDKISREDVQNHFGLNTDLVGWEVLINKGNIQGTVCVVDTKNQIIYK